MGRVRHDVGCVAYRLTLAGWLALAYRLALAGWFMLSWWLVLARFTPARLGKHRRTRQRRRDIRVRQATGVFIENQNRLAALNLPP